jgi:hypothetical protein
MDNFVQKVVEGHLCAGPVEKNSCRIHATYITLSFVCIALRRRAMLRNQLMLCSGENRLNFFLLQTATDLICCEQEEQKTTEQKLA